MNTELSRFLCTFLAFDRSRSQNVIVAHSLYDALEVTKLNPNCKEVLEVKKIEESGPKVVRQRSNWISDCMPDNNPMKSQLIDELTKLHK